MNPYDVLGVSEEADPAEVHAAWRRVCTMYRPDQCAGMPADVQQEAARRMSDANAAYDALQTRFATPTPSKVRDTGDHSTGDVVLTSDMSGSREHRGLKRFGSVGIAAAVVVVGLAIVGFAYARSETSHEESSTHNSAQASASPNVREWLAVYHAYVDQVHAKWNAGPAVKASTGNSFEDGTNSIIAAQQFCGDMAAFVRDQQTSLFPSPNRELDLALGAWIDATVAYWGTCPLSFSNAQASNRLGSEMQARQSAVSRLVSELGR
jgi:hypothetical protein